MLKPIIFWGASGQAKVLHEFIDRLGYTLAAVFDNARETVPPFPDVPLHYGPDGFRQWHENQGEREIAALVAIGGGRGQDRLELQRFLQSEGLKAIVAIHPTAFVAANARVGEGSQILAQAAVCAEAQLGAACIVNTKASVDHECVLGLGVHIGPGATVAGCVRVDDYAFVGSGAVVLPRVRIGRNVIVGAGAVVTKDLPDFSVAVGNPAHITRENSKKLDAKL